MKVLLLGNGGREHAIAWALGRSGKVDRLDCAPGNPGIAKVANCYEIDPCDPAAVLDLALSLGDDHVVVGPEAPLVAGVSDKLRESGIHVFGPGRLGARLEGSKAFAKTFMKRHQIPTAPFDIVTDMAKAREALCKREAPFVVKADGLAAGKGAFLPETFDEALKICHALLVEGALGEAGRTVVIEDYLPGSEITVLAVTDGKTVRQLPSSQDHKRAFDGDKGPNTGGMGAYTPVPWADKSFLDKVSRTILEPTVAGLEEEGIDFTGVLYAGLMVDSKKNCRVLEYNVRLGDPEAQVVLRAFPGDWGEVVEACCAGHLASVPWTEPSESALGIVMASGGYPGEYRKGHLVLGIEQAETIEGVTVFQAGTKMVPDLGLVTSGGRVLTVVAKAPDLACAKSRAYEAASRIAFADAFFRTDISWKAGTPPWPVNS